MGTVACGLNGFYFIFKKVVTIVPNYLTQRQQIGLIEFGVRYHPFDIV